MISLTARRAKRRAALCLSSLFSRSAVSVLAVRATGVAGCATVSIGSARTSTLTFWTGVGTSSCRGAGGDGGRRAWGGLGARGCRRARVPRCRYERFRDASHHVAIHGTHIRSGGTRSNRRSRRILVIALRQVPRVTLPTAPKADRDDASRRNDAHPEQDLRCHRAQCTGSKRRQGVNFESGAFGPAPVGKSGSVPYGEMSSRPCYCGGWVFAETCAVGILDDSSAHHAAGETECLLRGAIRFGFVRPRESPSESSSFPP